jgi:hypothetical protein
VSCQNLKARCAVPVLDLFVIPVETGIHFLLQLRDTMDSRFHGNDIVYSGNVGIARNSLVPEKSAGILEIFPQRNTRKVFLKNLPPRGYPVVPRPFADR